MEKGECSRSKEEIVGYSTTTIPIFKNRNESRTEKIKSINKNNLNIEVKIETEGGELQKIHAYLDNGSNVCLVNKHVITAKEWEVADKPIRLTIADGKEITIEKIIRNLTIYIEEIPFEIPLVYYTDTQHDLIIGNNFFRLYQPYIQTLDWISFTKNTKEIKTKIIKIAYQHFLT